ncbi:hypothetical protein BRADI_5g00755v3 [Brachypodium distachyon]|uniref:Uncharacterized protein n=1 Tax=Brachypodium distachyon TaxID=15368 RepID=A0A2K2CEP2_BRADI|nr:hypothetical protein BRADI_5g00755v3 [Brachypodium distachyon]
MSGTAPCERQRLCTGVRSWLNHTTNRFSGVINRSIIHSLQTNSSTQASVAKRSQIPPYKSRSTPAGAGGKEIKRSLYYAQDLLQQARKNGVADDRRGLQLSAKADQAEDALDELHYFMIQDQLDGTRYAVPDLGDHARHGRHALRHTERHRRR